MFLQEARGDFKPVLSAALGGAYAVFAPATPSKSNQNSLVALRTSAFDAASVVDVTDQAMMRALTLTLTLTLTLKLTLTLTLTLI